MKKFWWLAVPFLLSCQGETKSPGKNYVLITLDTVRADHIGAYGYETARTPWLDSLAENGALFENAVSVAPITMPTHSSIMTGRYPNQHGVRNNGSFALKADEFTLAEAFKENGFDTAAVVSALVLDSKFGVDQGFRIYDDDLYGGPEQKMFMFKELKANQTVDKAIRLATSELKEPFFLWVHLFDAHADYEPPPPYDVLFFKQPYDGEIAFLDKELKRFDEALASKGLLDRTTMMVTADHGDSLGEHGEKTHGIFIYRATTHIPLLVRGPGIKPQRLSGVASQVDLFPTLWELADLKGNPKNIAGVSLASALLNKRSVPSRKGVYVESMNPRLHFGWSELRAVDTGTSKYIRAPKPEFYDLEQDKDEKLNLFASNEASSQRLDDYIAELVGKDDPSDFHLAKPDAQTKKMLSALGYMSDAALNHDGDRDDPKDVAHRWKNLQKCQAMVRAERNEPGASCLREIIAEDPQNWTARLTLTNVLQKMKKFEEAEEVLKTALELDPTSVKALENLSQIYKSTNRPEDAIAAVKSATGVAPSDPEPWTVLGDLYQELGRPKDAVGAYSEALNRDENFLDAYLGIANTFHKTGNSEKALKYLEYAVGIDNNSLAAWYNTGVIADSSKLTDKAEEAYKKALELDPTHVLTHNNLGSLYNRAGKKDEAEKAFLTALRYDPTHVESIYNLATLFSDKNPQTAERLYAKALSLRPNLLPARHNLGALLAKQGRVREAIKHFTWVTKNAEKAPGAYVALAELYVKNGSKTKAREMLTTARKQGGPAVEQQISQLPALSAL